MSEQKTSNVLSIPIAILVAGLIIAGAVYFTNNSSQNVANISDSANNGSEIEKLNNLREITEEDHIKGDIKAPIKIVTYTDFECPFCKRFHITMNQIMEEYGESGQVAWVYRQFPLEQLHPVKARVEAIASECVADLAGNDAFWSFTDRFFELTPGNNQTDIETVLPQIAGELGINVDEFNQCLTGGKFDGKVDQDFENGVQTGARGTPWSIFVAPDGSKTPINGALSYESVKQLIEANL